MSARDAARIAVKVALHHYTISVDRYEPGREVAAPGRGGD